MSQVEISDAAVAELKAIAEREHRVLSDVLSEAIQRYVISQACEPQLASVQIARLKNSIEQANRSEFVSEETVEKFFDDWERQARSK